MARIRRYRKRGRIYERNLPRYTKCRDGLHNGRCPYTGKARCAAPGRNVQNVADIPGGDAAHLSGLQVTSRLRSCSRARRVAPPPGETCKTWQTFPEAMLRICPGWRLPAVCGPVARERRVAPPAGVIWRIYPARESAGSRNRIRYRTRRRFLRAGDRQPLRSPTGWRRKLNRNGCR